MPIFTVFGDIKRVSRSPRLEGEGVTTVFGDVTVDFTRQPLEPGEHQLSIATIFGDIKLRFPENAGIEIDGFSVFSDIEVEHRSRGEEELTGASYLSENYESAAVRVRLNVFALFGDIEVMRVPAPQSPAVAGAVPALTVEPVFDRAAPYEGQTHKLHRGE